MVPRDSRPSPLSLRPALILVPLALLATVLLGLLAQAASATHPVDPPTALSVTPGPYGTATSPGWTYTIPADQTATCTLSGPAGAVDVTCPTDGSAARPVVPLTTDGSYTFSVTTTRLAYEEPDPADTSTVLLHPGGTSAAAESTYVLDRMAPVLEVGPPTAGVPYGTTSGWTVLVTDDSPVSATCTLSPAGGTSGAGFTCNGATTPALTTDGTYTLTVVATDAAGNVTGPAVSEYVFDGTVPVVSVALVTASPGIEQQPSWSFTADEGAVTCALAGPDGPIVGGECDLVAGTYTAPALTASGSYTLTVAAEDTSGNVGSTTSTYVLDLAGPTIGITPPGATSGTAADISWSVLISDAVSATCTLSTGTAATCDATGGTVTESLASDGTVTLTVTALDALGNQTTATASYTRDTTPGTPTVTVSPTRAKDTVVTWSFTTGALTDSVQCRLDGPAGTGTLGPCTSYDGTAGTYVATLTTDGTYTLHVFADNATSTATPSSSATYDLDRAEPNGPTLTSTHTGSTGSATSLGWTWSVQSGHTTYCRLTVNATIGDWGVCDGAFSTTTSAQGTYTLQVQYVDGLGNAGTISSGRYTFDSIGPATPTVTLVGDATRQPGPVTWTFTTTPDVVSSECRVIGPGVDESTVAWGSCTMPVSLTGDGVHRFEVRNLDEAGNASLVGDGSVTLDGSGPSAPDVPGTDTRTKTGPLTWSFTHTDADVSFRCRLVVNGVVPDAFTACTSNYSHNPATQGTYRLDVVAVDAVGNVSAITEGPTYTYDSVGPDAPDVTLDVTSGKTKSATWDVTPTEAGLVECRLTRTVGAVTTEVSGWSACTAPYTFTLTLDGVYVLEVRTYDDLLNVSAVTPGPGYTLDATAPAQPTVAGSRDGQTDNELAVSYTYSGEGTATCRLYRDGVLVTPAGATCSATTYTATLPRVDGTYTLEVTFTDAFDNTSTPGPSGDYTLDVSAPARPTVAGSRDAQTDNERAVSYAYSGEGTATCYLYRDDVLVTPAIGTCTDTGYTVTLPETSGTYRLEVTFTDAYGNISAPGVSGDYVLDVTLPGLATVTVTPRTDNVESATWMVTPPEANTTTECRLLYKGAVIKNWHLCTAPYTYALVKGDGEYVLEVRVIDAVGNVGPVAPGQGYVVDMTPPLVPVVTSNRTVKDNERSITYAFSGEGVATCQLTRDGTAVGAAVVGCTTGYTITLPNVSGVYVLQVTYTDAVGNVSDPGPSPAYDLDVTPPDVPVVTSDRSGTDNERVVTYQFSGEGTATCQLTRDGVAVGAAVTCASPWVVTLPTTDGEYVLLVTYTDAVGNTSAPGRSVAYVLDLTAPPAPIVLGPPPTGNTRAVTWTYSGEGTAICQLLRDGVAYGAETACGATSFSTTLPLDGTWTLEVSFTDAVGNRGPPGTSSGYLLDTVAPVAPGVAGPTGPAQGRSPSWTITTETGTTVECRLLRGGVVVADWAACSGTYGADLAGLPDGAYVVEARATDKAGNVGPVGTSTPYVLDTTAPLPPSVSGPSGPSQVRTPSFTWIGETGTTAECLLSRDGVAVGGWVACSAGFSPTLDRDGTWTLTVRLTDVARNVSPPATSGGYVLDTTAPLTPIVTPPQSPGRDLAPSWGVVVEGGTKLECRLTGPDGVSSGWAECTLPHITSLAGRPDGAYVLEVRATDVAGNLSPVGSGRYVLDTEAPAAAVVTSPASPGRSRTPSFSWTAEAGSTTRCRLTSGTTVISDFTTCTSPAGVDLTGLPDGTYTLTVRVADAAGNIGPAATGTYVLDTTGPDAPVLTLSPASPSAARRTTWAFTYEPGSTLLCRVTSPTGAVRDIAGCTSPFVLDLTGQPEGTWTLTVRAVDSAGNVGAVLTLTYVLDLSAVAGPEVTGPVSPGSTRTPRWTISTATTTECRLTFGATVLRDWGLCAGSFTADLFGKPDGTYVLSVRTKTATGKYSAATTSRYVLDTTPPAGATIVAPPSPSTNRLPVWTIASPELGAKAECKVLLFGSVLSDWAPCAVSPAGSLFSSLDLDGRGDGTYTLVVRLTDAAGNRGPEVSSAYVLDTSAPVGVGVTGPPSPGNDTTPTWTFTAGGATKLECRLTSVKGIVSDWDTCSGSFTADLTGLPDGTYTLAVRAISAAGTPGPETTSAYVLSTEAPNGPGALALSGTKPTSNDRSPTWTFTLPAGTTGRCIVVSGARTVFNGPCSSPFTLDLSSAPDGSYTLTVTAVDAAGTPSAGVSSTYVLDTVPTAAPVFTQVPGSTGSTLDPQWRFTVVYGATAECRLLYDGAPLGDWTSCTSPFTAVLTGRPDGRYTLEVRAVDAAGNSSAPKASTYLLDRTAAPIATFTDTPPTPGTDRTVSWTVTSPAGTELECRLVAPDGTSTWQSCSTAGGATATFPLSLTGRPDGDYVLEVRVVEEDGRRGSVSRATYTLDTKAPAAPRFSAVPPAAGNESNPRWSWDSTGDERVECRLVRVGGAPVTDWAACTSPYEARLTAQGTYALEIRVVDAAGNLSPVVSSAYRYDTTAPAAATLTSRPPAGGSDRSVSWTFTVPADATATCTVTRGVSRVDERTCSGRYDLDLRGMPDGVYTLTIRLTDAAGNVSTATTGRYALTTVGLGGPGRVDRPSAPTSPGGGSTSNPPAGPGRGGTSSGGIVPRQGSTPRPGVPNFPVDTDVPRSSVDRPNALTPTTPQERNAAPKPDPGSSDRDRGRNPLLADPLPIDDVPEALREAVTSTITRPTLPLALLAIVILFLLAQNRIDRRDPKLASAPVEAEPELDFTTFIRRPGGALS